MPPPRVLPALCTLALALLATACGGAEGDEPRTGATASIVVTTNILGDVVAAIVGDQAEVTTIMPVGANPHDFQASAQQAAAMRDADLLVVNGGGFEEGLEDVIEGAEDDGVTVVTALEAVDVLDLHGDDERTEDHRHSGESADPHFFTDPNRMVEAVRAIAAAIVEAVDGVDGRAVETATSRYIEELEALDTEIERAVATIPERDRVLVTNHEVFGYFAERYGFEVVATVIPSGSTAEGASAGDLSRLAGVVRERGVRAIFADASGSNRLAETLAAEVGGEVEVVELYSESLGEAGTDGATYLDMMAANATRIVAALT